MFLCWKVFLFDAQTISSFSKKGTLLLANLTFFFTILNKLLDPSLSFQFYFSYILAVNSLKKIFIYIVKHIIHSFQFISSQELKKVYLFFWKDTCGFSQQLKYLSFYTFFFLYTLQERRIPEIILLLYDWDEIFIKIAMNSKN